METIILLYKDCLIFSIHTILPTHARDLDLKSTVKKMDGKSRNNLFELLLTIYFIHTTKAHQSQHVSGTTCTVCF